MRRFEYKVVAAPLRELEALLNELGRQGWGVAFLHSESGHIHAVLYREAPE